MRLRALFVSLALLVATPTPGQQSSARQAESLSRLCRITEAAGYRVGVWAQDARSEEPLFQHRGGELFIPASNQKLLTVAAALHCLGPDFMFRTSFRLRAGALQVLAAADPNWVTGSDHDPRKIFAQLAARLTEAGVTAVRGIELLPGPFTGPIRPAGWPQNQFERDYCAASSPFLLDRGCFRLQIEAQADGEPARLRLLTPPDDLPIQGRVVSGKRGSVFGARDLGHGLRVFGGIHHRARNKPVIEAACKDPMVRFRQALLSSLTKAGIEVRPDAPKTDAKLLRYDSRLLESLSPILRESSNVTSEQVLRAMSAARTGKGDFVAAARFMRRQVSDLVGILPPETVVVDGSGMSRSNRVTPQLLAELLRRMLAHRHGKVFLAHMPQGGVHGTLRKRFRKTPKLGRAVFAKTGTLNGVSCLSGVVALPTGGLRAFAILMQRRPGSRAVNASSRFSCRRMQERMVASVRAGVVQ